MLMRFGASPESACVSNGVLLLGVSWPFVKSTANKTYIKRVTFLTHFCFSHGL